MKNIVTIFVENTINLELLTKYLKKTMEMKTIDEVHFWNYTKTPVDDKNIKQISNISRTTSNEPGEYTRVFTTLTNNEFFLNVTAENDVHIKIKDSVLNIYYEIVLGGWNNTKSIIRKNNVEICSLIKKNLINNIETNIKVSIKNNFLGIYKNDNIIFNYELDEIFNIDEIYVKTGYGSVGNFTYETTQNKWFYLMDVCDKNKKHYYCDYYKNIKFINDIIIKCDDKITFIDLNKLPKFIEFIKTNDYCDVISGNVINNNICSLYQQHKYDLIPKSLVNLDFKNNGTILYTDNNDEKLHSYFIKNYDNFIEYEYNSEVIQIETSSVFNFNFVGYKANIFYKFNDECDNSNLDNFLKNKKFKTMMYCDFYASCLSKNFSTNQPKIYKLVYDYNQLYDNLYNDTNELKNYTNVVVARYNKNVDFAYKINNGTNINIFVYDKENPENPFNVPVNKGNEASVFLKYIIDFYNNLSEYTFFIHDEEFAWHHTGSIVDKYNEAIASERKYYNINDKCFWNVHNSIPAHLYKELLEWYNEYVEEYIPINKVPNNTDFIFGYHGSAQFLVHKHLIRSLPREFYKKIYDWIITTDLPNYTSGRFLEWTWHVFWRINPYINEN